MTRQNRSLGFGIATEPTGTWLQTEREAHEKWARLTLQHPKASVVMHMLLAKMGRHNALVVSLPVLCSLTGCSRNTLIRAIAVLRENNWIEVRQIGAAGTTNCYVVNDRIAWVGARDGKRYSLFSAAVIVAEDEQPDRDDLGNQPPLEQLPTMQLGERQLPTGPGLPPPSQPALAGLEPDLPALRLVEDGKSAAAAAKAAKKPRKAAPAMSRQGGKPAQPRRGKAPAPA